MCYTSDFANSPLLSLSDSEWARNDKWLNWKGVEFSGWKEYKYVTGTAVHDLDENQKSKRDKGHEGWTVGKFCACIDDFVRTCARNKGKWDAQLLEREEVLAIRLYTIFCARCRSWGRSGGGSWRAATISVTPRPCVTCVMDCASS
jgi:hypothetical protein